MCVSHSADEPDSEVLLFPSPPTEFRFATSTLRLLEYVMNQVPKLVAEHTKKLALAVFGRASDVFSGFLLLAQNEAVIA